MKQISREDYDKEVVDILMDKTLQVHESLVKLQKLNKSVTIVSINKEKEEE